MVKHKKESVLQCDVTAQKEKEAHKLEVLMLKATLLLKKLMNLNLYH